MINHQFVWKDDDDTFAGVGTDPLCDECDGPFSRHVNIEGITHEDELIGFDDPSVYGSVMQYYEKEEWN